MFKEPKWTKKNAKRKALEYLHRYVPVTVWGPRVSRQSLVSDIIGGLIVGIMIVPTCLSWASLASIPLSCGLSGALFASFSYGTFGQCAYLSLGPVTEITTLLISISSIPLEDRELTYQSLGVQVGILAIILSFIDGGKIIKTIFSKAVGDGYTCAAAILAICVQMKVMFNVDAPTESQIQDVIITTIQALKNQFTIKSFFCFLLFFVYCGYLIQIKRFKLPIWIPHQLIVVIVSTLLTWGCRLDNKLGLTIVQELPSSISAPHFPPFANIMGLAPYTLAITIISFVQMYVIAVRQMPDINPNGELFADGATNFFCNIFSGMPVTNSFSCSAVLLEQNVKTPLTAYAAGCVVLITIFGLNRLNVFYYLPKQCLAAIVVASVWRLVDFSTLINLWKYSKIDALVWVLTFVLTIFKGITVGVLCGIAISLVLVVLRIARPRAVSVGFSMTTLRYGDLRKDPELLVYPNILMWRFDAPLYFVNYSYFQEKLTHALRDEVRPIDIIIATCAKVVDIDSAAMSNLPRIIDSISTLDPDRPRRIILTEIHGRLESVLFSTALLPIYVPEEHDMLTMNQIDATGKFPVVFKDLGDAILFAQRYLFEKYGNVDISPYPHVSFVTDVVVETAKMQLLENNNNNNNNMHHGSDSVEINMHHDDLSGQGSGVEGNDGWREFEMIENGQDINNNYNTNNNNANTNETDNNLSNAERNLIACLKKLRKISRFTPDKELIGVIGVVRHTELTPKQKKKFFFHEPELLQLAFAGKDIARNKRTPEELEPFFSVVEGVLARGEMDIKSSENWRRVLSIIRSRPQGLKIQMKPVIDYNVGSFNESFCANASFAQKIQSALLVVKWGGVLTKSGIAQANVLGEKLFARFFAAGDLPLHRLIKFTRNPTVFASDENRVITTALVVMNSLNQHKTLTKDDIILNDRLLKTLNTTAKNLLHDEYKYFESLLHIDSPAATRHFFHIPGFRELLRVPQPTPEPEVPSSPASQGELVHFISDMVEKMDEDIDKMDDVDDEMNSDEEEEDDNNNNKKKKKNKGDKLKHAKVGNGSKDKKSDKNKKNKEDNKSKKTTSLSHAFSESDHENKSKTSAITREVEHHVDPHHMNAEVHDGHPVFLPPSKKNNIIDSKTQKDANKTTQSQINAPLTNFEISETVHGNNNNKVDLKMVLHGNSSAPHQPPSSLLPPLIPASQQQHQRMLSYAAQEYYTPIQVLQELELNMRTVVNMDIPSHIINVPLSNHETLKELRSRYEVMLNNLLGAKQRRTVEEIETRMHAETVNNFTNIIGGIIRDEDDDEDEAGGTGARADITKNSNNNNNNAKQIQKAQVKENVKGNADLLSDLSSAHSNDGHNNNKEDSEDDDDEDENGEPLEDVALNRHHHGSSNINIYNNHIPSSLGYDRTLNSNVASPITATQHTAPHHTVESLTHQTRSTSSKNAPYSYRSRKYDVSDVSKLRDYASYDIAYNLPLLRALFATTRMTSLRVVIEAIMRISKITEGMSRVGENVLEGVNSSKRFIIGSLVSGQLLKRINEDFKEISLSDERRGIEELLHRAQRMYIEANGGVEQDLKHFFNIFKKLRKTVRNASFTEEYTETAKERELRKRFPFINLPDDVPEHDHENRETSHRQPSHEDEVSNTRFYFTSYLHVEGVVHCLFESDTVTGFSRPSKEELEASLQLYMKHLIFKVFRRRNLSYTNEEAVEALRKVSLLFTTDESYTQQQHRLRDELVAIYHAMFYVSLEVYLSIGDVDPNVEETEMTPIFTVEDAYPSNNLSEIVSRKEDERTEMDEEGSIIGPYSQLPSPTSITQLPNSSPLVNMSNTSSNHNININNNNNNYLPSASASLVGGVGSTNAIYDGPLSIFGNSPPINHAREEEASNSTPRQPGNRIPSSRLSVVSPALLSTNAQERSTINRTPLERRRKTIVMQTPQAGQKTTLVQQMKNRVNSVMPMQRIHEGLSLNDFMRLIEEVESAINSQVMTTNTANTNSSNNKKY